MGKLSIQKIIVGIFIIIGITLRVYQFNEVPGGLFSDEISIAVNAKTIAQSGVDEYGRRFPFAFESLSDYKLPGYIYTTAFFFKLFGPQLFVVRLAAVLSSIASIFLLGVLAKTLFPERKSIGWYAAFVVSLCLFHIHFARIAYETMLATTFFLVYLICVVRIAYGSSRWQWISLGGVAILISCFTYPAPKFIIPTFTVLLLGYSFVKPDKVSLSHLRSSLLLFLGFIAVSFIPSILNPKVDKRPLSYIVDNEKGPILPILFRKSLSVIASWLWIFNLEFLFDKGDVFAFRHGTRESGIFLSIFLPPFIWGIFSVIRDFSKKNFSYVFVLLLLVICGIPSALTSSTPYGPRLLPMMIPLCLLVTIGVYESVMWLSKRDQKIAVALWFVLLAVLSYQIVWFAHIYFVHFRKDSLPEFPQASRELGQFIKEYRQKEPSTNLYLFNERSCRPWGHDDLHVWYFADLPNTGMIAWNNAFRVIRYNYGSPFDAYDGAKIPSYTFGTIHLYPGYKTVDNASSGSLIARCGIHLPSINQKSEKILKIFYVYPEEQREVLYVVTRKLPL